jgi:electron transfer flavoprotein beta subunit
LASGYFCIKAVFEDDKLSLTRETDAGLETIKITLPAVITTDLRLNEPRLPKLPDIMKAKKKPIDVIEADSLGVNLAHRLNVLKVSSPPVRDPSMIVANAAELIDKLKNEAGVL